MSARSCQAALIISFLPRSAHRDETQTSGVNTTAIDTGITRESLSTTTTGMVQSASTRLCIWRITARARGNKPQGIPKALVPPLLIPRACVSLSASSHAPSIHGHYCCEERCGHCLPGWPHMDLAWGLVYRYTLIPVVLNTCACNSTIQRQRYHLLVPSPHGPNMKLSASNSLSVRPSRHYGINCLISPMSCITSSTPGPPGAMLSATAATAACRGSLHAGL